MALIPNVVADTPILSTWGNQIRDRTVQLFATAAERAAQWTTPPNGAVSILTTLDTSGGIETYLAGQWRKPWNLPWGTIGYVQSTAAQTGLGAGATDLTGLTLTNTYVANRLVRVRGVLPITSKVGAGGEIYVVARETAQFAEGHTWCTTAAERNTLIAEAIISPSAGPHTYKLAAGSSIGTMDVLGSATAPNFLHIEDVGPAGAPA